jgi:hypothetical protein
VSRSASKLLVERVDRQVVDGRVAPYVEPPSVKALGESLLEELLGKWHTSGRVTTGKVARQVSCLVCEWLCKSLGESLE